MQNPQNPTSTDFASLSEPKTKRSGHLPGGEKIASVVHGAAGAVSTSAEYLRANDFKSMMEDARTLVRNNPGVALLSAAALGFIVAKTFSKK